MPYLQALYQVACDITSDIFLQSRKQVRVALDDFGTEWLKKW
jgi:EAL domain-containing protein (putative c-di-GMP-specific phosphodiesterase class I)